MISVETPEGTVVIVEVISLADKVLPDEVVLVLGPLGTFAWMASEVVLPQTFKMPEDPRDTVQTSVVNASPPGVMVVDPMIIAEASPDAVRSGLMVTCRSVGVAEGRVVVEGPQTLPLVSA